ncbi:hypothetical protein PO124_32100 [Bacillus licheniformis]|nr:hypothetical protein [Bacillus licheniformis]
MDRAEPGKHIGKVMLGLERPQSGQIFFKDMISIKQISQSGGNPPRPSSCFQDSYSSVNPRMTAEQILAEPLETMKGSQSLRKTDHYRALGKSRLN